jgi:hypothetical protein
MTLPSWHRPARLLRASVLAAGVLLMPAEPARADGCVVVAQTGFNSPYYQPNTTVVGYGNGEPGWAAPWTGVGNETGRNAIAQADVVFEGDLALRVTPTDRVQRVLAQPQTGLFAVDQALQLSAGGRMLSRIENSKREGGPNEEANIGVQWIALEDGRIVVLDGDGLQGGTVRDTGFRYQPGVWHRVTTVIDVGSNTWRFFFDGAEYAAAAPLGFRGTLTSLDAVQYLSEVSGVTYVDDLKILAPNPQGTSRSLGRLRGGATPPTDRVVPRTPMAGSRRRRAPRR